MNIFLAASRPLIRSIVWSWSGEHQASRAGFETERLDALRRLWKLPLQTDLADWLGVDLVAGAVVCRLGADSVERVKLARRPTCRSIGRDAGLVRPPYQLAGSLARPNGAACSCDLDAVSSYVSPVAPTKMLLLQHFLLAFATRHNCTQNSNPCPCLLNAPESYHFHTTTYPQNIANAYIHSAE